ncbi:hypothetical protein ACLOJK_034759 [Asimina triloba]
MEPTLRSSCSKGHTPPAVRSSHASIRHRTRSATQSGHTQQLGSRRQIAPADDPRNPVPNPSGSVVLLGHPHPKKVQQLPIEETQNWQPLKTHLKQPSTNRSEIQRPINAVHCQI